MSLVKGLVAPGTSVKGPSRSELDCNCKGKLLRPKTEFVQVSKAPPGVGWIKIGRLNPYFTIV